MPAIPFAHIPENVNGPDSNRRFYPRTRAFGGSASHALAGSDLSRDELHAVLRRVQRQSVQATGAVDLRQLCRQPGGRLSTVRAGPLCDTVRPLLRIRGLSGRPHQQAEDRRGDEGRGDRRDAGRLSRVSLELRPVGMALVRRFSDGDAQRLFWSVEVWNSPRTFPRERPAAGQRHDPDDDLSGHHLRSGAGRLHQGVVFGPACGWEAPCASGLPSSAR